MRRMIVILTMMFCMMGCTSRETKDLIRSKHAQSYVLNRRINDTNPKNDPTLEQLKEFTTATSKDWESLDRIINNWKPTSGMQSQDLEGNVSGK